MVKAFLLIPILFVLLASGCTTETGNVVESTKLTISDSLDDVPESIEDVRKEFEDFEKSQAENLSQQNESLEEAAAEKTEQANETQEKVTIPEQETAMQNESVQKECASCEDNNPCTEDTCSEQTDYECVYGPVIPCCGNGECEESEGWDACPEDCECSLDCDPCEIPDSESCSCLPETECASDGCCPAGCAYPQDPDCPRPSVIFSEIYYNPNGTDTKHEWVEIFNNGTIAVDITKWRFQEDETQHLLKNTTSETSLKPKSYAVIVQDDVQFLQDYPDYQGMVLDSSFSLSNTGEELILRTGKDGEISDSIFYNSTWGGDGTGFSLEKIDLNGLNTPENWNQSTVEKGTPGQKNSIAS